MSKNCKALVDRLEDLHSSLDYELSPVYGVPTAYGLSLWEDRIAKLYIWRDEVLECLKEYRS